MSALVSKKGRSVSREQLRLMVSCMEEIPALAENKLRQDFTIHDRRKQWEDLTASLNALGGAKKSSQKWQKCWTDKKGETKKKAARIQADRKKAGNGLTSEEKLTALEERILKLTAWVGSNREEVSNVVEEEIPDYVADLKCEVFLPEEMDTPFELSATTDREISTSSLSNPPVTVTSTQFTRKRKKDEHFVEERTEIADLKQLQEQMEEVTHTKIRQLAAAMARPEETSALNRIAAACEIQAKEAVKQTLLLERILLALNK